MSRVPLVGTPPIKQSKIGYLIGNNPLKPAQAFRIRRNKWSIIKFILITSISIYLLLYIKSLVFNEKPEASRHHVVDTPQKSPIQSPPEHLPLIIPIKKEDTSNQASAQTRHHHKSNSHASLDTRITLSSQPSALDVSRPPRRRKLIAEKFEVKKRRLDEQLKTLMPVVSGWGENGKGVKLTSAKEKEKAEKVFRQGAYNVYISDRISPNRSLHSVVAPECNDIKYNVEELPNVSVIIIFTNEIFSALVRTVWSVINRTPKRLLKEIILVDDFSDKDYLKQTLQDYIDVYWNTLPKYQDPLQPASNNHDLVKLIHLPKRLGLIKARLKGAREAQGDILLFLDSHCETTDHWFEPLAQRIKENNRVFICPVIDIINDKTLEYNAVDPYFFQLGGFDWTGHFTWINRKESDAQREPTKATKSPTMAGGLFAVDRKYFFELGSYDEEMIYWGGENLELSFRAWQCGGRVEIHPCSHVGHIFRDFHPYSFDNNDSHGYNTLRTVLVWMDKYSKYFFMSRPDLLKMNPGDLSARKKLREDLKCQSFKWYLDNIYDKRKFIYDENVLAYGWVKNPETNLCIDVLNKQETSGQTAGLYTCERMEHPLNVTTNQLFSYAENHEIRREEGCLTIAERSKSRKSEESGDEDVDSGDDSSNNIIDPLDGSMMSKKNKKFSEVQMSLCEEPEYVGPSARRRVLKKHKRQMWRHEIVNPRGNIRLLVSEATGECLTTEKGSSYSDLLATVCDKTDAKQHWEFQIYNSLN